MRHLKILTANLFTWTLLLVTFFATGANADQWNKKTILTTTETIEVPGATLQPGKYVVKLANSNSNRHIVQFFNEDETKLLSTVLAIPNERLQVTGETHFSFYEMPAGQAPALRAWFYPGDNFGQEFAYPKNRATAITQVTKMQVPVAENGEMEAAKAAPAPAPAPRPRNDQVAAAPAPTPAPAPRASTPEPAVRQQPAPRTPDTNTMAQAQPQERPEPFQQDRNLPATASPAPLVGLIGLLTFAGALGLSLRKAR
jgi:hypothetical protein